MKKIHDDIYIYEWACSEDTRYKENEEDMRRRNYNKKQE